MYIRRQWYDVNDSLCSDCSNIKKYRKFLFDILFAKLMTKRKYATTFGTKHNNNTSNNNMIVITVPEVYAQIKAQRVTQM